MLKLGSVRIQLSPNPFKKLFRQELILKQGNVEISGDMYTVFLYHLYGVDLPDLQLAIDTWHYGADNASQYNFVSWLPDAIYVANLGLTNEAKDLITKNCPTAVFAFLRFGVRGWIGRPTIIGAAAA